MGEDCVLSNVWVSSALQTGSSCAALLANRDTVRYLRQHLFSYLLQQWITSANSFAHPIDSLWFRFVSTDINCIFCRRKWDRWKAVGFFVILHTCSSKCISWYWCTVIFTTEYPSENRRCCTEIRSPDISWIYELLKTKDFLPETWMAFPTLKEPSTHISVITWSSTPVAVTATALTLYL